MAEVRVYYDRMGSALTVWFEDPAAKYICEEPADEVILMRGQAGQVIGFEKLNYRIPETRDV